MDNARLYEEARRATQARDDVLGIVAHDLRSPLNAILMQTSLMRRSELERRSQAPLDLIERGMMRMNRLIQDLLDVTSMEAGRLSMRRGSAPTRQMVLDAVQAHTGLAKAAALDLRVDLAPELPEVCADRDRVLQVFENLIGNALKFTAPGGRITVGAAPRAGEVLFWVADTGAGIPSEQLPHAFERFWQAKQGRRRGAGLGLAIVKGIVEAHGGQACVESVPGQGSRFTFTIPLAGRRDERRPPRARGRSRRRMKTSLGSTK